jgi:hypothetical protein
MFPDLIRDEGQLFAVEIDGNWRFEALSPEATQRIAQVDPIFLQALLLPTKHLAQSELSGFQILEMLEQYLGAILRLPSPDLTALSAFIVSTYFADVLPIAPSIAITTHYPEQEISAFTALASICRYAIVIDDSVPLTRVPLFLGPTLAIDATSVTGARLERLCPVGSPAIKRMVGSRVESFATPRIIFAREPVCSASLSFILNPPTVMRITYTLRNAQTLVNSLAAYRLSRRSAVTENIGASCLLIDLLLAGFPDDNLARERVGAALTNVGRSSALPCIGETNEENFLTQALYAAIHRGASVSLLELANLAMDLFEREGMRRPVSPKYVGAFLRRHGLTLRHTRVGMVLDVNERSTQIAHRLFSGAFSADCEKFPNCPACAEGARLTRIQ